MDYSTPALPIPHHHPKLAQVHVRCIGDAIQSSHLLMPSSPFCPQSFPASGTSPIKSRCEVCSSHQVTKTLKHRRWQNRKMYILNVLLEKYLRTDTTKANRVLPRERTGHSKHSFPTTQEKTLHMDITRQSITKSD